MSGEKIAENLDFVEIVILLNGVQKQLLAVVLV